MSNTQSNQPQDQYFELWKASVEAEERIAHDFDLWMITLSGGALGLSVTFIRYIAPHPVMKWMLVCAWAGFGVSLLLMLISMLTSQSGFRRYRAQLEKRMQNPQDTKDVKNCWACVTNVLNWVSAIGFIFGVAMLAWFSIKNLP